MAVDGEAEVGAAIVPPAVTREKDDEELTRLARRKHLKALNMEHAGEEKAKSLDSSLKRHTALIKRMRQSLGTDNFEQIIKDVSQLSLEKYIDELAGAAFEGSGKCKTERDVWSAVEIISALHRRFPNSFTPVAIAHLSSALAPPQRTQHLGPTTLALSASGTAPSIATGSSAAEQRERDESLRVSRQRPILRVCSELALVGIIKDGPGKSGGEWMMKTLKDLLSNDPTLSSLPLLSTFLKSYARPFLGIAPSSQVKTQISDSILPGSLAESAQDFAVTLPSVNKEEEEESLIEKDIRARFKKMCEGYFDNVAKKLLIEHRRLQEQDRRNHEAYIRSGEIFEDRQQAYEKMTKSYEKLLTSCQTLSELLCVPMPTLPTETQKSDSIVITSSVGRDTQDDLYITGGKWEDEEERRFFEDLQDLADVIPKTLLGLDEKDASDVSSSNVASEAGGSTSGTDEATKEKERIELAEEEAKQVENELKQLQLQDANEGATHIMDSESMVRLDAEMEEDEDIATPIASPPKTPTRPQSPTIAPQGPSQLLTALLAHLPDATNRSLIDSAAIDFAFLNSKAARKRLVKFLTQVPKNRSDLLPHYSRLVATLNKYMPDIGSELLVFLEDEFRYLQRKKNVVRELAEVRQKNIAYLSNLTKFKVVPTHVILHIFKVCLDDFSGVNIENLALLLEGCGRFLLRSDETKERFATMVELLRRKQSLQHLDERQTLLLENAYYQCNPPERAPRVEKERSSMELFIRHLVYDVLAKKTIDKVLKLIRKLDWNDPLVVRSLFTVFTKPWKLKYSNIGLLAMLAYDLLRYHPDFSLAVVDQVLEDIRSGMETNVYKANQQRVASTRYLGELYIYRVTNSSIIFDTFWSLVTFGHPDGRPMPHQACSSDMPDDFFRIRLVCVLLDTCGMCFEKGSQKKKLDNFLAFFQLYVLTKSSLPMDVEFMLEDSLESVRPKLERFKSFEQAVEAVDEIFSETLLVSEASEDDGDESSDESDGDDEDDERREFDDEGDEDHVFPGSPSDERPSSPDTLVVLNTQEKLGPSEEEDADFAKELAKMVTESSTETRKLDKRTAQALWDSAVLPSGSRKKVEDTDEEGYADDTTESDSQATMKFMFLTKKGNKQQTKRIAIPTASALATHTLSAQMQERAEQQQLKRLVLDYEHREEVEELKALESRSRNGAIKIRYAG